MHIRPKFRSMRFVFYSGASIRCWVAPQDSQNLWKQRLHESFVAALTEILGRLSEPTPGQVVVEKFFSGLESQVAPILKSIDRECVQASPGKSHYGGAPRGPSSGDGQTVCTLTVCRLW